MNRLSTRTNRPGARPAWWKGDSIRSTCRMTGAVTSTVVKLVVDLGPACSEYQDAALTGNPDRADFSTSYVECQNLTMWMGVRRFTRLTDAFSKNAENPAHAVSRHFICYNLTHYPAA